MPVFPSIFPLWWIALSAALAASASVGVLRWRVKTLAISETLGIALVVGVSVLVWRLSANVPSLNDDPIGGLSPNDWLCPVITYVGLSLYAAFRPPPESARWAQTRALLTIVAFVVNVFTI